jgi:hypothetical protein
LTKLDSLSNPEIKSVHFEMTGEDGFGVLFDNGYSENDERISIQKKGNEVFNSYLEFFLNYISFNSNEFTPPTYHLTRRLKYYYPKNEDSLSMSLSNLLDSLCTSFDDFLNQPRYKLYKEKSDTLSKAMSYIGKAHEKCTILREVLTKINSGFFDYNYRSNFYMNGINGLNKPDSISYQKSTGLKVTIPFDMPIHIDNSKDLLLNMNLYAKELGKKSFEQQKRAVNKVKLFKEQEEIDKLDRSILTLQEINDSLYRDVPKQLKDLDFNQLPFSNKIYLVFNNSKIADLKNKYLQSEEYNQKVEYGIELECLLNGLHLNYHRIISIEHFQKSLDSLFTIYVNNPFDFRQFESKILGNIKEKGGFILFNHYLDELLKSNKCSDLEKKLVKIEVLQKRLEELALNYKDESIIKMNRLIKRENVPSRIERLLSNTL